jgi:hypothetical protein
MHIIVEVRWYRYKYKHHCDAKSRSLQKGPTCRFSGKSVLAALLISLILLMHIKVIRTDPKKGKLLNNSTPHKYISNFFACIECALVMAFYWRYLLVIRAPRRASWAFCAVSKKSEKASRFFFSYY